MTETNLKTALDAARAVAADPADTEAVKVLRTNLVDHVSEDDAGDFGDPVDWLEGDDLRLARMSTAEGLADAIRWIVDYTGAGNSITRDEIAENVSGWFHDLAALYPEVTA